MANTLLMALMPSVKYCETIQPHLCALVYNLGSGSALGLARRGG
jgi:hypothetical protein